jgi:hypothetical protein
MTGHRSLGLPGAKNKTSRKALRVAVLISHEEGLSREGREGSKMGEKGNGNERAKGRIRAKKKYSICRSQGGKEEGRAIKKMKEAFPGAELSGSEASGVRGQ